MHFCQTSGKESEANNRMLFITLYAKRSVLYLYLYRSCNHNIRLSKKHLATDSLAVRFADGSLAEKRFENNFKVAPKSFTIALKNQSPLPLYPFTPLPLPLPVPLPSPLALPLSNTQ